MPENLTYDEKVIIERLLKQELNEQESFIYALQKDYNNKRNDWSSVQMDAYHNLKNQADADISNILSAILKLGI